MKKLYALLINLFVVITASALTYNVTVPVGTNECYIVGSMSDWSVFEPMTKVDNTHYTIDLPQANESHMYKYCCGPGWNYVEKSATGEELLDRSYSPNDVVANWANIYTPGTTAPTPDGPFKIYLEKSSAYPTTYLYIWDAYGNLLNGLWPGSAMTNTEVVDDVEYHVYEIVSDIAVNIIFNDNSGNQTVDILDVYKTTFYRLNGTSGKVDVTEITPGEVVEQGVTYNVTVPIGTPACYIAGEFNNWIHTAMDKVSDTQYTIYIDNATKLMKYKYSASPNWDNVEMQADGVSNVQDRSWTENDVVAAWAGIQTGETETLVYNVTVPMGTPGCYIIGKFNDWSTFVPMDRVDDTHYTITLDNVYKTTNYKYTCGEGWEFVEMQADGISDVQDRTWAENDVVAAWKSMPIVEEPETLIYTVTVPTGTNTCYIASAWDDWANFYEMTKIDENHYTITLSGITRSTPYKYLCGPDWMYVECNNDGSDRDNRRWSEADVVDAWKELFANVESVAADKIKVYGVQGALCFDAQAATQMNIYNAQGMMVKNVEIPCGYTQVALPKGMYVVNGNKVLVY